MIFSPINDEKLLEKYKTIWTKTEDLKHWIKWFTSLWSQTYKKKIRTYDDKVYTNFRYLNVPEYDLECESFTVIAIDSLLVYGNKYYLNYV